MSVLRFIRRLVVGLFAAIGAIVVLIIIVSAVTVAFFPEARYDVPDNAVLTLDLADGISERGPTGPLAWVSLSRELPIPRLVAALDAAGSDGRVKGLIVRVGAGALVDGKPRTLHVRESLASIRFDDHEPALIGSKYSRNPTIKTRYLVSDPLFQVDAWQVKRGQHFYLNCGQAQIVGIVQGRIEVRYGDQVVLLNRGQFMLLPAVLSRVTLTAQTRVEFLMIQPGQPQARGG